MGLVITPYNSNVMQMWIFEAVAQAPAQVAASFGWGLFGASIIGLAGALYYFFKKID